MTRCFAFMLTALALMVGPTFTAPAAFAQEEAPTTQPAEADAAEAKPKYTKKQDGSYGMGVFAALVVRQMQAQMPPQQRMPMAMPKDAEQFQAGFDSIMQREQPRMDFQQIQQAVLAYAQQYIDEHVAVNKPAEQAFMKKNAELEGVKTTESGLQYKITEAGEGKQPAATDRVTVHYTGTLLDGTVFDSSKERGQPATFGLNQVIDGWTEGLQLMKEGGKATLYVPNELAYGNQLDGPGGPGAMLIFEVELIKVTTPPPAPEFGPGPPGGMPGEMPGDDAPGGGDAEE